MFSNIFLFYICWLRWSHTINEVFMSLAFPAPFTEKESKVQRGTWLALGHRAGRYQSQG